jgi:hypothetical protein
MPKKIGGMSIQFIILVVKKNTMRDRVGTTQVILKEILEEQDSIYFLVMIRKLNWYPQFVIKLISLASSKDIESSRFI